MRQFAEFDDVNGLFCKICNTKIFLMPNESTFETRLLRHMSFEHHRMAVSAKMTEMGHPDEDPPSMLTFFELPDVVVNLSWSSATAKIVNRETTVNITRSEKVTDETYNLVGQHYQILSKHWDLQNALLRNFDFVDIRAAEAISLQKTKAAALFLSNFVICDSGMPTRWVTKAAAASLACLGSVAKRAPAIHVERPMFSELPLMCAATRPAIRV